MNFTGERQVAPVLSDIKADHLQRYRWAVNAIKQLSVQNSAYVLDAACGVGYGTSVLADAEHNVTGVDISAEAIAYAEQHYSRPTATFEVNDVLAFTGVDYDVAVAFEAVEHVKQDEQFLRALHKAAHWLLVSVPNEDVAPFESEQYPFHVRHYTPDDLEALMIRAGWEPMGWHCQYDKNPGDVFPGDDGRTLIVVARRALS